MKNNLWLSSALIFALLLVSGPLLVMVFNTGGVNHALTPIVQYWSLFQTLWQDNPLSAGQFILTKSVLVLAHKEPRSGLNVWTYEIDTITLLIYLAASIGLGWLIRQYYRPPQIQSNAKGLLVGVLGTALLAFTFSYMTSIEHCSGATWVGFVTMYGVGFSNFQLYPYYQWVLGIIGLTAMAYAVYTIRKTHSEWADLHRA